VRWFRSHYGAGPIHLLGLLICFAIAAYAVTRVFGEGGWKGVFSWFVICLVIHDLIAWPLYTWADRKVIRWQSRRPGRPPLQVPWINHVRVPTIISGTLLVMFSPLIFRISNLTFESYTGFSENIYLTNWLMVTVILFAGSAVVYLLRLVFGRQSRAHDGQTANVRGGPK
jgi:hypothetical protein